MTRDEAERWHAYMVAAATHGFPVSPREYRLMQEADRVLTEGETTIDPMSETVVVAIVHTSGPWEDEWNDDGDPVQTQRCLRCDVLLRARGTIPPDNKKGWPLGSHVAIVEEKNKMYDADHPPHSTDDYEEEPCV